MVSKKGYLASLLISYSFSRILVLDLKLMSMLGLNKILMIDLNMISKIRTIVLISMMSNKYDLKNQYF